MSKAALFFSVILCLSGHVFAQRRTPVKQMDTTNLCASTLSTEGQSLQRSVADVDLRVITRHPDGGVSVGGSVYINDRQGLILHSDGSQLSTILIPKVTDVEDFAFTTREVGWRLYAGTLYATNDGGACWRKVFRYRGINSMYFTDAQHGWLTGLGGIIYHTDDGGLLWRRQNSGTNLDLQKIFFVDPLHGWVLGKKAYGDYPPKWKTALIATNDGGRTWGTLVTDKTLSLYSYSFINSSEGWGIDSRNKIVHTIDGGRTWTVQRSSDGMTWTSIFFVNEREGWVAGDGILYTNDSGISWKFQLEERQPEHSLIETIFFTDSQNGWAIRAQQLLQTANGGLTWETIFKDPRITTARN